MQHLENMNHLREGIHWISVGQKDPLVEYRRQSQILFNAMQLDLRHEVIRTLFSAQPVDSSDLERPTETAITKAARKSIDNADKIIEGEEYHADDFSSSGVADILSDTKNTKKQVSSKARKKNRKNERARRAKGRRRK